MALLVSNLPASVTGDSLLEMFERFGKLARVYPSKDSRCIVYKHSSSARELLYNAVGESLNYNSVDKYTVCSPALRREAVQKYGPVKQFYHPNWKVLYKRFEDAQRALNSMDGRLINGQRIKVEYDSQIAVSNAILLEATINRMYGQPVSIPTEFNWKGLDYIFISYDKVSQLTIRYLSIEPSFQVWAGPPGTENIIITIEDERRDHYLVLARLEEETSKILPPVESTF